VAGGGSASALAPSSARLSPYRTSPHPVSHIASSRPRHAALSLREPKRPVPADMASVLRYYTASMHRASFKLPQFAEAGLSKVRPPSTAGEVTRDDIVRASAVAVAAAAVVGVGAFILARALRR
jgi:hypothetical protein